LTRYIDTGISLGQVKSVVGYQSTKCDRTSSFLGRRNKLSVFGRLVHTLGMAGNCDGIVTVAGNLSDFESISGKFITWGERLVDGVPLPCQKYTVALRSQQTPSQQVFAKKNPTKTRLGVSGSQLPIWLGRSRPLVEFD